MTDDIKGIWIDYRHYKYEAERPVFEMYTGGCLTFAVVFLGIWIVLGISLIFLVVLFTMIYFM